MLILCEECAVCCRKYADWIQHLISPQHKDKTLAKFKFKTWSQEEIDRSFVVSDGTKSGIRSEDLIWHYTSYGLVSNFYWDEDLTSCAVVQLDSPDEIPNLLEDKSLNRIQGEKSSVQLAAEQLTWNHIMKNDTPIAKTVLLNCEATKTRADENDRKDGPLQSETVSSTKDTIQKSKMNGHGNEDKDTVSIAKFYWNGFEYIPKSNTQETSKSSNKNNEVTSKEAANPFSSKSEIKVVNNNNTTAQQAKSQSKQDPKHQTNVQNISVAPTQTHCTLAASKEYERNITEPKENQEKVKARVKADTLASFSAVGDITSSTANITSTSGNLINTGQEQIIGGLSTAEDVVDSDVRGQKILEWFENCASKAKNLATTVSEAKLNNLSQDSEGGISRVNNESETEDNFATPTTPEVELEFEYQPGITPAKLTPFQKNQQSLIQLLTEGDGSLDQQLERFVETFALSEEDHAKRRHAIEELQVVLFAQFKQCEVHPLGSFVTGLTGEDDELDVHVNLFGHSTAESSRVIPVGESRDVAFEKTKNMVSQSSKFNSISIIPNSIIKVAHASTGVVCVLSFESMLAVQASNLIAFFIKLDERVSPLLLLTRYWARFYDLCGPTKLNNYALALMVFVFLIRKQILPSVYELQSLPNGTKCIVDGWNSGLARMSETRKYMASEGIPFAVAEISDESWAAIPTTKSMLQLLIDFFEMYSSFDFKNQVICSLTGEFLWKKDFTPGFENKLPDKLSLYKYWARKQPNRRLQTDMPFCQQDVFDLSLNVTADVDKSTVEHFVWHCKDSMERISRFLESLDSPLLNIFVPVLPPPRMLQLKSKAPKVVTSKVSAVEEVLHLLVQSSTEKTKEVTEILAHNCPGEVGEDSGISERSNSQSSSTEKPKKLAPDQTLGDQNSTGQVKQEIPTKVLATLAIPQGESLVIYFPSVFLKSLKKDLLGYNCPKHIQERIGDERIYSLWLVFMEEFFMTVFERAYKMKIISIDKVGFTSGLEVGQMAGIKSSTPHNEYKWFIEEFDKLPSFASKNRMVKLRLESGRKFFEGYTRISELVMGKMKQSDETDPLTVEGKIIEETLRQANAFAGVKYTFEFEVAGQAQLVKVSGNLVPQLKVLFCPGKEYKLYVNFLRKRLPILLEDYLKAAVKQWLKRVPKDFDLVQPVQNSTESSKEDVPTPVPNTKEETTKPSNVVGQNSTSQVHSKIPGKPAGPVETLLVYFPSPFLYSLKTHTLGHNCPNDIQKRIGDEKIHSLWLSLIEGFFTTVFERAYKLKILLIEKSGLEVRNNGRTTGINLPYPNDGYKWLLKAFDNVPIIVPGSRVVKLRLQGSKQFTQDHNRISQLVKKKMGKSEGTDPLTLERKITEEILRQVNAEKQDTFEFEVIGQAKLVNVSHGNLAPQLKMDFPSGQQQQFHVDFIRQRFRFLLQDYLTFEVGQWHKRAKETYGS